LRKSYLSVDTSRHSQEIIDDLTAIQQNKWCSITSMDVGS
jgi:hypothetical protein